MKALNPLAETKSNAAGLHQPEAWCPMLWEAAVYHLWICAPFGSEAAGDYGFPPW